MRRTFILAKRNLKEIVREPLSLVFCVLFPSVMLTGMSLLFSAMEYVPEIFLIENYSVGICVFGFTFTMLFIALSITSDKGGEFINRIKTSPAKFSEYIGSYYISSLPIMFAQTVLFMAISAIFGLKGLKEIALCALYLLPSAVFYVSLGTLIGSIAKNEKQAGPFCSVFISATCLLGGVFMPTENMGVFTTITKVLPFSHSVNIASGVFYGDYGCIYPHILWVIGYTIAVFLATLFINKLKNRR